MRFGCPVDANRADGPRAISAANKSRFDSRLCRGVSINIVVSGLGLKGGELRWGRYGLQTVGIRLKCGFDLVRHPPGPTA